MLVGTRATEEANVTRLEQPQRRLGGRLLGQRNWAATVLAGSSAIAFLASPVKSAETIAVKYGPFEVMVPVDEIDQFAQTGELTGEIAQYSSFFPPEQQARFRAALQQKLSLDATLVSQLIYSPTGDMVLNRLGTLIQAEQDENGASALGAAIVQAAASPEGLSIVSLLRQFPASTVQVNADRAMAVVEAFGQQQEQRDRWVSAVEAQASQSAQSQPIGSVDKDLTAPGDVRWEKLAFDWVDNSRSGYLEGSGRPVPADLYLPQVEGEIPLVLLSHGVASNRKILAYLAEHLVSHGVAVAVPEHVGSNGQKMQRYFDGVAEPPEPQEAIDRPQDMSFILDQLTALRQTDDRIPEQLQLDRVVAIGQSFGGYTALALGGAELNLSALRSSCQGNQPEELLNVSLLLQCRFGELSNPGSRLADDRVAAVLAVNPFTSRVFNPQGLQAVDVPLMLVSGSADFVVPPVEEQLEPFAGLTGANRYLALMRNGTHFSVLDEHAPQDKALPITEAVLGEHGEVAREYLSALSLAFVRRHGSEDERYDSYLTSAYGQQLSRSQMPLSLVRSLSQP